MYANRIDSLQRACQELMGAKEKLRLAEASLRFYLTGSPGTEEPMDLSLSDWSEKSFSDKSALDSSVEIVAVNAAPIDGGVKDVVAVDGVKDVPAVDGVKDVPAVDGFKNAVAVDGVETADTEKFGKK